MPLSRTYRFLPSHTYSYGAVSGAPVTFATLDSLLLLHHQKWRNEHERRLGSYRKVA